MKTLAIKQMNTKWVNHDTVNFSTLLECEEIQLTLEEVIVIPPKQAEGPVVRSRSTTEFILSPHYFGVAGRLEEMDLSPLSAYTDKDLYWILVRLGMVFNQDLTDEQIGNLCHDMRVAS